MICENCQKPHDGSYGSGRFCSKGCANTRKPSDDTKTKISKTMNRGKQKHCKECGGSVSHTNRSGFCKKCKTPAKSHADNVKTWRKNAKLKAIEYKGGKCIICTYNKSPRCLDFHHLNPEDKEYEIGKLTRSPKSWDLIQKELDKCILLCCRCHGEIHDGFHKDFIENLTLLVKV